MSTVDDEDVLFGTARLVVVRRWRDTDLDGYGVLNADPRVMEHLSGPMTRQDSDAFARYGEEWLGREGFGLLPVVRRADGVLLGMSGMHRHRWFPDQVEIGWRFAREAWGHGYATESAAGWLRRGFTEIGLPRVISITSPANVRSQAVMRRLGLVPWKETVRPGGDGSAVPVVVFTITWRAWQTGQAGQAAGVGPSDQPQSGVTR